MNELSNINEKIPKWYNQFEIELYEMYNATNNNYPNVVLTGSGVIAFLLKQLKMYDELKNFEPGDLDFLYKSRTWVPNKNIISTKFGNYEIKSGQENVSSVTFISKDTMGYIKSFDVSKIQNLKSFNCNGIEIINLNRLKLDYKPDLTTEEKRKKKDLFKISLIEKIISKIGTEYRLDEFGLDDNITKRESKCKTKLTKIFDDNENIFMNSNFEYDITSPKKTKLEEMTDDNMDIFMFNNFEYNTPSPKNK